MRDFALYILICSVVIAAIAGVASTGVKWNILFKGLQFFIFPIILLGTWIPGHLAEWKKKDFRVSVALVLLLHSVGFALLAAHYETLKPSWTSALAFLESVAFVVLKDLIARQVKRP